MGLRETKKAQAREAISTAATALFLEKGFDAVSVAEVAVAANVSTMTVFNYFARKEDLFLDRGEEACALARAAILEAPAGIEGVMSLAVRLVAEGHAFTRWTPLVERYFRVIRESASLRARVRELREQLETDLTAALVELAGTRAGDATAHILAVSLVSAWTSAHATATAGRHAGKRGDALGNVFLRALGEALAPIRRAARGTPYERTPNRLKAIRRSSARSRP